MRTSALLATALLFILSAASPAHELRSNPPLELERTTPSHPTHLRKPPASPRTATAHADQSNSKSFTFSSGGSNFKFNFNGGWDGNGFNFQMNPGPKALLRHLWIGPFELLSRGRMIVLWLAASLAIAALFQPHLLRAQEELRRAPGRSIVLGVIWNLVFWALLAASALLCLILIGVPLLIILVAFHFVLSVFGMALVFSAIGERVARRINQSPVSIYVAILVGGCFLGLLRVLPFFGPLIWFTAGLFGTGAALAALCGAIKIPAHASPTLPA